MTNHSQINIIRTAISYLLMFRTHWRLVVNPRGGVLFSFFFSCEIHGQMREAPDFFVIYTRFWPLSTITLAGAKKKFYKKDPRGGIKAPPE